jgi:hypothetical protein
MPVISDPQPTEAAMSQRSRRFLAAQENAMLAGMHDRAAAPAGPARAPLVPTLKSAIGEHDQVFSLSAAFGRLKDTVADALEAHGEAHLDRSRERIDELTARVVAWGKRHPLRMVGAAAALIAVSGFLLNLVQAKADQVRRAVKTGRSAKARLKAKVRGTVKALTRKGRGPRTGRAGMAAT